jgi:hypothetical protein
MRPPRAYLVVQHLVGVYVAVLLGFVILAVLVPAVVSARDTARRAVCTTVFRQHSASCPDTVCLERGRIVWVSRCWVCGTKPDNRICFVEDSPDALNVGADRRPSKIRNNRGVSTRICDRDCRGLRPER